MSLNELRNIELNHQLNRFPSQAESEFCMLLALPCGRDKEDIERQTNQLCTSFIKYMKDKDVAGIAESKVAYGQQVCEMLRVSFSDNFVSQFIHNQFSCPTLML